MHAIIEHLDGTYYDLLDNGIVLRDFKVSSPTYVTKYAELEGLDGELDLGTTIGARVISASFYIKAEDATEDYVRARDLFFNVFNSRHPFYIRDMRQPSKRWLVKVVGNFTLEQDWKYGFIDVELRAASGYSESVNSFVRSYSESLFTFRNDGDTAIDMRTQKDTEILFTGASSGLTITNETTGDVWEYSGETVEGDSILIKGVQSFKNGLSIFKGTNKRLVSMSSGNNKFNITGAIGEFTLVISTRYYFL